MNVFSMGTQWGDEGKGKVNLTLAKRADIVVRFNGGPNAGSHVVFDGRDFKFHQIPSAILLGKKIVLTHGMVLDPEVLEEEVVGLEEAGISVRDNLYISDCAHVIHPKHRDADSGGSGLGTTRRGIGYCYADKMLRVGKRIGDLDNFFLKERVFNTSSLLRSFIRNGQDILFQGSQGFMLDIDMGNYPFVTSSSVSVGGMGSSTGVSPRHLDLIIGVTKAYTTRVAEGPFPTERDDALFLQKKGQEIGVTTGRKRRCGWLDLVALRYAVEVNGIDTLFMTKLDILDGLEKVLVCFRYKYKGHTYREIPETPMDWDEVEPVYVELPGWEKASELNSDLMRFLSFIETETGASVGGASYGIEEDDFFSERVVLDLVNVS